jgi:hypothetical protein
MTFNGNRRIKLLHPSRYAFTGGVRIPLVLAFNGNRRIKLLHPSRYAFTGGVRISPRPSWSRVMRSCDER